MIISTENKTKCCVYVNTHTHMDAPFMMIRPSIHSQSNFHVMYYCSARRVFACALSMSHRDNPKKKLHTMCMKIGFCRSFTALGGR
jgi:hypothetical protein